MNGKRAIKSYLSISAKPKHRVSASPCFWPISAICSRDQPVCSGYPENEKIGQSGFNRDFLAMDEVPLNGSSGLPDSIGIDGPNVESAKEKTLDYDCSI